MIRKSVKNWRDVLQDAMAELHEANIRELDDARYQYPDASVEWVRSCMRRIESRLRVVEDLEALSACSDSEVPFGTDGLGSPF